MLELIQELKNTEKKAAASIEDAHTKTAEELTHAESTGRAKFEALQVALDNKKLDALAVAQKEVDVEVARIERAGKKELESLKSAATSNRLKLVEAVQKAMLQ